MHIVLAISKTEAFQLLEDSLSGERDLYIKSGLDTIAAWRLKSTDSIYITAYFNERACITMVFEGAEGEEFLKNIKAEVSYWKSGHNVLNFKGDQKEILKYFQRMLQLKAFW